MYQQLKGEWKSPTLGIYHFVLFQPLLLYIFWRFFFLGAYDLRIVKTSWWICPFEIMSLCRNLHSYLCCFICWSWSVLNRSTVNWRHSFPSCTFFSTLSTSPRSEALVTALRRQNLKMSFFSWGLAQGFNKLPQKTDLGAKLLCHGFPGVQSQRRRREGETEAHQGCISERITAWQQSWVFVVAGNLQKGHMKFLPLSTAARGEGEAGHVLAGSFGFLSLTGSSPPRSTHTQHFWALLAGPSR